MIHWIWILAAFVVGWITGMLVTVILTGGGDDDNDFH